MRHLTVPSRVALGILLVFLVSCGTGHDADEKYYLISTNVKIPYWQAGSAGLFQAAQQLKVRSEFAGPDSYDPKAEQKALQEAVQSKASGILISVADPALLKDDIDRAIAAGIPVITVDSDAPASKRLFFIGTDNYHAGQIGGQRLAKELNGKGNVVVFTIPEQANLKERLRGYRDALEASPQIKITPRRGYEGRFPRRFRHRHRNSRQRQEGAYRRVRVPGSARGQGSRHCAEPA